MKWFGRGRVEKCGEKWLRGGEMKSLFRGKRYCGDRNTASTKECGKERESRTECGLRGLCVSVGGDGRRYCETSVGAIVIFFGVVRGGASVRIAVVLGDASFGGKRRCGKRVVAGKNIFDMREDGEFLSAIFFYHEVAGDGGGGRRYCGESVGGGDVNIRS